MLYIVSQALDQPYDGRTISEVTMDVIASRQSIESLF